MLAAMASQTFVSGVVSPLRWLINSIGPEPRAARQLPHWTTVSKVRVVKHPISVAATCKSPLAERLVERRGAAEHTPHIRDLVDPPVADRLVERRGAPEHRAHIRDLVDAPVADRLVE